MPTMLCPPHEKLIGFASGNLPDDEIESVTDHLESCAECESAIELLEEQSHALVSALRQPDCPFEHDSEPEFAEAVAAAKALVWDSDDLAERDTSTPLCTVLNPLTEYRSLGVVGRGGMGIVYKALHLRLQRVVAVKVLPVERRNYRRAVHRFGREIAAAGKLDHPHIVRAYDAGESDGMHFLVMELVEGIDLRKLLKQNGPLRVADACELVRQAATGLQHAHEHGLVHRDVKPSNLLLSRQANLKVLDLGLALLHEESRGHGELTDTGQIMGTLDYMAPEQANNSHDVDGRADIYSLGCTFYQLLAGCVPFGGVRFGSVARKIVGHAMESPRPIQELRPDVPDELAQLIARMLSKHPGDRPQTAAEVAAILEPWAVDSRLDDLAMFAMTEVEEAVEPVASAEEDPSQLTPPPLWHLSRIAGLATVGLAAALLCGVVIVFARNSQEKPTTVNVPNGSTVTIREDGRVEVAIDKPQAQPDVEKALSALKEAHASVSRNADGKIREVKFDDPAVTDADLTSLAYVPHLRVLKVYRDQITDAGVQHIKQLKDLEYLRLWSNQVTDEGLWQLRDLKHLEYLNVAYTGATDEGIRRLQQAMPHCHVVHAAVWEDGEPAGGGNLSPRWSEVISAASLDTEIRALQPQLVQDLASLEHFKRSGHQTARRHFSELAMLMAITAQYDGDAKYKESAETASARFSEVAFNSKVGTERAYERALLCLKDLSQMLGGQRLQGREGEIDWSRVVDRPPIMQRLGILSRDVFGAQMADEKSFTDNRDSIRHHAELVAAIGTMLRQPGMPQADDSEYAKFAEGLSEQAGQLAQFAAEKDFRQAAAAVRSLNKQCANCHADWRP